MYLTVDLKKYIDKAGLDPILLQNPINFGYYQGRIVADFNCDRNPRISEVWIQHLIDKYNVNENVARRLESRLGRGGGIDLLSPQSDDELLKLFVLILADYQNSWDEMTRVLREGILNSDIPWGNSILRENAEEITGDIFGGLSVGDRDAVLFLSSLEGERDVYRTRSVHYCLPGSSSWISRIINDLKVQALNTVFSFPDDANASNFFDWITTNWGCF
ncbi:MAG: hypothetical protein ACTSVO_04490 [Candidatus Heimdallarchaeaceae archaeon]